MPSVSVECDHKNAVSSIVIVKENIFIKIFWTIRN